MDRRILAGLSRGTRRFISIVGAIWSGMGLAALALAIAFLSWRIPTEREEMRVFWEATDIDDGPHLFWLDEYRFRVVNVKAERQRHDFLISEAVYDTRRPLPDFIRGLLEQRPRLDPSQSDQAVFPDGRVLALSDVHGQYRGLTKLLRNAGFVDAALNWVAGTSHLVIAGDVFDKGPSVTKSLWLIRKLESQAAAAGGRVHFLLGNHDHLALTGKSQMTYENYRLIASKLNLLPEHLFSRETELGRWLRQRNSIVKIGRRLYVHAGLSPRFLSANLTLEETNRLLRLSLSPQLAGLLPSHERGLAAMLSGGEGPLWWRGYFDNSFPLGLYGRVRGQLRESAGGREAVRIALSRYDVSQIVVGHTYTRGIRSLYGGQLVALCQNWGGPDLPNTQLNVAYKLWEPRMP